MAQITTTNKLSYYFSFLIQAIKGQEQDYTTGSLRKAIFMLAIPMILEMVMESVFAVVDLFFVSRIGQHAVSTIGLTESVLTLVYSLAVGISMAATATIARRIGEQNTPGAATAAMQCIWLGIGVSILITSAGFVWAPDLLRLMGAEKETIAVGTPYVRIMFGGSIFIVLLFLINGIFRGAGNAAIAMKSLWLANGCNIILCPLFIYGLGPVPAMGLTGAAVATTIGRGIGVCYQLFHLFNGKGIIKLKATSLKAEWAVLKGLVQVAWPATLQFIIGSCSWIFLARLVAETGHSEASAGYQTAIRIVMFFLLPAWGLSNAAATLVGQSLGAKDPARAQKAVLQTAKYNAAFMGIVSFLFIAGAPFIVGLFTSHPQVAAIGITALRIISTGYVFYGIGMVLINAFNGAGDTRTPTLINVFCFWLFQIPLAYLLSKTWAMGPTGVFIAIPVAETLITITAYVLFKKGKWKTISI